MDSQPFSIQQFLGATGLTGGNGTITLTGQLAGGGTVTTNINLTPTYTTIAVDPSFTNLSSLTIVDDGQGFSLDNIAVNGASATPEPGTFLLLGVAAIPALLLKRKKSATRSC